MLRSTVRAVVLGGCVGLVATGSAHATFVGDLVFCDLNRNGVYEPGAGEPPLNGVGVTV